MTLREFKEVFTSKPITFTVTLCFKVNKVNCFEKYHVLNDFYDDDLCDGLFVDTFSVHDGNIRDIFITLTANEVIKDVTSK